MEMWIGHLQTSNFDFYVIAESEEILWSEMERSWNSHRKATGATYSWDEIKDNVWFNKQHLNRVWKR
ncbi:MAG: hypothetical protein EBR82_63705 [Caulobacteraceae bacterium]|nr:hypothetical protein [Caulobacteraceae bacterium]